MTETAKTIDRCSCGKPANHTMCTKTGTVSQCCECYVKDGHPPADWHIGCMATYRALKARENA